MTLTPEAAEFYPTPYYCVHRFLEAVELPRGEWIEPCVGNGAIIDAVTHGQLLPLPDWTACDVRAVEIGRLVEGGEVSRVVLCDATRDWRVWARHYRVGITNPPFSKALAIVQQMLKHCDHVAILQRLNWLASEERADWLRDNPPGVYVLPNRPSFTGDGATDGADYAWFLWPPQHSGVMVLNSTPLALRRRDEQTTAAYAYRGPEQAELFGEEVSG